MSSDTNVLTTGTASRGPLRTAWRSAHEPAVGVPRRTLLLAYAVPFLVLPSSIWRILTVALHVPLMDEAPAGADVNGNLPEWIPIELYVVLLSIGSELLAFTAIGLVARWGEVFPRWLPGLRGRRVPISLAVVPAALGSVVLTLLWGWAALTAVFTKTIQWGDVPSYSPFAQYDYQFAVASIAYLPLVLWGPFLAALTVGYYRRRTGR
ncbi:hypothetical protein [Solicola gregarius]|uniref:Uncharacterized protein n=1 Tax=Solicola gregarius TaxID=2908642 RepID=A0AA46TKX2_9ACTN|nr:hypothetical protein [Solicola gregarius]UYM07176.1 hypothetical protein L0C25_08895 [Solicola gregarius]